MLYEVITMHNHFKKLTIALLSIGFITSCNKIDKVKGNPTPIYLDASETIENRVNDLMARMTLEEKVYQMCQYVGLEHMKTAESEISLV